MTEKDAEKLIRTITHFGQLGNFTPIDGRPAYIGEFIKVQYIMEYLKQECGVSYDQIRRWANDEDCRLTIN